MTNSELLILDFSRPDDRQPWQVINDGVMGGKSRSEMVFTETGTAVFQGTVSLENNGGFASTRTSPRNYTIGGYSGLLLQVRGDGRDYQLRVRTDARFDGISYRYRFATHPGGVQTIRALFSDFEPVFRGQVLENIPQLTPADIRQIGFLIADSRAGAFRLEIDWIKAFRVL